MKGDRFDRSVVPASHLFTLLETLAARTCNLSVSVEIVASRDDFAERGSVSRSRLGATAALDLSKRWAADKAPAGHGPALLWLRLRRAALYRRVALCQTLRDDYAWDGSKTLPIINRRYGRLKICAAAKTYPASCRQNYWRRALPTRRRHHLVQHTAG